MTNEEFFICNLCGCTNSYSGAIVHRELLFCAECRSTARFRGVLLAFQKCFFSGNEEVPFKHLTPRKDVYGLGFSDWEGYASELSRIFNHTETYFHKAPRLDLMDYTSVNSFGQFDYVLCSEVIEHVEPPVIRAFEHLRMLVKNGGVLILSVPFLEGYDTIEHFPHLHNWEVTKDDNVFSLRNTRADHVEEICRGLQFHGGPGAVLEMRIFGEQDLVNRLKYVGFENIDVLRPEIRSIGYVWNEALESPLHRGRRQRGHILVCR